MCIRDSNNTIPKLLLENNIKIPYITNPIPKSNIIALKIQSIFLAFSPFNNPFKERYRCPVAAIYIEKIPTINKNGLL